MSKMIQKYKDSSSQGELLETISVLVEPLFGSWKLVTGKDNGTECLM